MSSDVTLPIRDIRNANPAWVRSPENMELDRLKRDLKERGMLIPVLLTPDFVMLDGARRVLAAEALHWREVPVTIAHDWDAVRRHFELVNVAADAKPMAWSELFELWTTLLKPIHRKEQAKHSVEERRRRAALREAGKPEAVVRGATTVYTKFTAHVAEMAGFKPLQVKLMRDVFTIVNRLRVNRPEVVKPVEKLITEAEKLGPQTVSTIRTLIRTLEHNKVPLDVAIRETERSLSRAHSAPWRLSKQKPRRSRIEERDPTDSPPVDMSVVNNMITLLEQVSREAVRMFNFTKVDPEAVRVASASVRASCNRINAMRRRLEASVQGERNQ